MKKKVRYILPLCWSQADVTGQGPDVPVLQASFLGVDSSFFGREHEPSIRRILSALRELCGIVWLLYVRDKLSLGLRKKLQLVERKVSPIITCNMRIWHVLVTWQNQDTRIEDNSNNTLGMLKSKNVYGAVS